MVHALETVHTLINPDGYLLDIHPVTDKAWVEVKVNGKEYFLDVLEETDDYIEYGQANDALAQVLAKKLFTIDAAGKFTFVIYTDTIEEMRTYLADNWKDAVINESIDRKAKEYITSVAMSYEILVREEILIARYKKN